MVQAFVVEYHLKVGAVRRGGMAPVAEHGDVPLGGDVERAVGESHGEQVGMISDQYNAGIGGATVHRENSVLQPMVDAGTDVYAHGVDLEPEVVDTFSHEDHGFVTADVAALYGRGGGGGGR